MHRYELLALFSEHGERVELCGFDEDAAEGDRAGAEDDRSWDCGAEGETEDLEVLALRARQQRNLIATLMLSQGVPMRLGGDGIGRSQRGNGTAWCQDNELSW